MKNLLIGLFSSVFTGLVIVFVVINLLLGCSNWDPKTWTVKHSCLSWRGVMGEGK